MGVCPCPWFAEGRVALRQGKWIITGKKTDETQTEAIVAINTINNRGFSAVTQ
jgi:hypothetical protein